MWRVCPVKIQLEASVFSVCMNDRLWIIDGPKINPRALAANNGELKRCGFSKLPCFTLARPSSEFLYIFQLLTPRWGGTRYALVRIPSLRVVWKAQMLVMRSSQLL